MLTIDDLKAAGLSAHTSKIIIDEADAFQHVQSVDELAALLKSPNRPTDAELLRLPLLGRKTLSELKGVFTCYDHAAARQLEQDARLAALGPEGARRELAKTRWVGPKAKAKIIARVFPEIAEHDRELEIQKARKALTRAAESYERAKARLAALTGS